MVSRDRSGAAYDATAPSASAASTSARLVSDLLPGSDTTASTGRRGARRRPGVGEPGAGRSPAQRIRLLSRSWPLRAAPHDGRCGEVAGLAAGVAGGAAGPPGDAGLALGVDRGDDQAAEHRDVLEEVDPLVGCAGPGPPSQNRWPAAVVGTSVAASTAAESRGARPVASARPAPIWATALMRTSVTGSVGIGAWGAAFSASGTSLSVDRPGLGGQAGALRSALAPPTRNIEASIGRASSRVIVMTTFLHDHAAAAEPSSPLPATWMVTELLDGSASVPSGTAIVNVTMPSSLLWAPNRKVAPAALAAQAQLDNGLPWHRRRGR